MWCQGSARIALTTMEGSNHVSAKEGGLLRAGDHDSFDVWSEA